jgi:hypothetical protein
VGVQETLLLGDEILDVLMQRAVFHRALPWTVVSKPHDTAAPGAFFRGSTPAGRGRGVAVVVPAGPRSGRPACARGRWASAARMWNGLRLGARGSSSPLWPGAGWLDAAHG